MKKVSAIIVCCLLVMALIAMPVLAAEAATVTATASVETATRGDIVVITLDTTAITKNAADAGAFILKYDASVFEFLGTDDDDEPIEYDGFFSECLLNVSMGEVTMIGDELTCVFAGNKRNIEGEMFTVLLKVKDTAKAGKTDIGFAKAQVQSKTNELVDLTLKGDSVEIKINCTHTWGAWTPDGANHKRVCTKDCGESETQPHGFGAYSVTTPAGCDKAGEKTATCATCGATDKQPVPATENHTWGGWTKVDDTNHKRTCTTCQDGTPAVETKAHTWGTATVTTPAGCDKAGESTQTCTATGCGATKKTVVNPTGDHVYGAWEKVDGTNHKRTCTTCQGATKATETKAHTFGAWTETLKPDCKNPGEEKRTCTDNCGAFETRPVSSTGAHNYNTWTKVDDEKHTAVCSGCGEFPKTENHTWNAGEVKTPAGCDKAGVKLFTCTATGCGATKEEAINPTGNHTFGNWTPDGDVNHKRTCTTCQDGTPEVQTEAHKPGTEMKSDATNHWFECACGQKLTVAAHTYDKLVGDADGHTEGCVCGVLKDGAAKAPHTFDEGVITLKPTNKKEGEKTFTCTACQFKKIEKIDKVSTPATGDNTLVIPMVILAVLSACGLAVTVVARKRASR